MFNPNDEAKTLSEQVQADIQQKIDEISKEVARLVREVDALTDTVYERSSDDD